MPNPIQDFPWEKTYVNADDQVLARPGVLHTIVLNGVTAVGTVTVYDDVDAADALQIIAVYNVVGLSVSYQGITFTYDCVMHKGIYITFTANFAGNLTVTYH